MIANKHYGFGLHKGLNPISNKSEINIQITFKELGEIGSLGCKIAYPDGKETSITLNLQNSL